MSDNKDNWIYDVRDPSKRPDNKEGAFLNGKRIDTAFAAHPGAIMYWGDRRDESHEPGPDKMGSRATWIARGDVTMEAA